MRQPGILTIALAAALTACNGAGDAPMVSLGIDDVYTVERMQKLRLETPLTGACTWTLDGRVVATGREYTFIEAATGVYDMTLTIDDDGRPMTHSFTVRVVEEAVAYSAGISEVVEYRPAPGQYVNEMPRYEAGDTEADMLARCTEALGGEGGGLVTLGGWGGYVTFRFDHTVVDVEGEADFEVYGNAFRDTADGAGLDGGSAEPGTVWVSWDANGNGMPDDPFYELAGSEWSNPATRRGHAMSYRRVGDRRIDWSDNAGSSGEVARSMFHTQSYWPGWLDDTDRLDFTGTRLPDNAKDLYGDGTYYVLMSFARGYADNQPNSEADLVAFDIADARDAAGNPAGLRGADFIRVQTGVHQYCGTLCETSTEVSGALDRHAANVTEKP